MSLLIYFNDIIVTRNFVQEKEYLKWSVTREFEIKLGKFSITWELRLLT